MADVDREKFGDHAIGPTHTPIRTYSVKLIQTVIHHDADGRFFCLWSGGSAVGRKNLRIVHKRMDYF